MKNFIFRKDFNGFEDRVRSINEMGRIVSTHKHGFQLREGEYKKLIGGTQIALNL